MHLTQMCYMLFTVPQQSFAKRLIEALFLFYLFIYLFILFTAHLSYRSAVEIKELECWIIECNMEKNILYQLQGGHPVYMPGVNWYSLQLWNNLRIPLWKECTPWFLLGRQNPDFFFTLKLISPMTAIPQLQKPLQMWLKNDFVGCLTKQFLLRRPSQ